MQAFTHFSRHAFERIAQRTKLSCDEIAYILDHKLTINTGRKPGFNRNHLVFYSAIDDDFFVALQDGHTGTVVTVLPLDYHSNLAWKVSSEDLEAAKNLSFNVSETKAQQKPGSNSTIFMISGHFIDSNGNYKTKRIKSFYSAPYENDIKLFLADHEVFDNLPLFAKEKGIDYKMIFRISIRHGSKGSPLYIDLQEVNAAYWNSPSLQQL
jgi:hypothetical protein